MCIPIGNLPASGSAFSSKTLQTLKLLRWSTFCSKMTQVHSHLLFTMSIQWFREPKTRFGAQNAFWSTSATSAPQNHQ